MNNTKPNLSRLFSNREELIQLRKDLEKNQYLAVQSYDPDAPYEFRLSTPSSIVPCPAAADLFCKALTAQIEYYEQQLKTHGGITFGATK